MSSKSPSSPLIHPSNWARRLALSLIFAGGIPLLLIEDSKAQRIWDGPALSFSNIELGYERHFFDEPGLDDADGFHVGLSIAPIPLLYFAGDFRYATADQFLADIDEIDFMHARAGAGLRATLLGAVAVYTEGGFAYGKFDPIGSKNSYDGSGFYVEPGLKVGLFGRLEASIAGDFTVLDDETIIGLKGGLMLGITDHFGISLDAGTNDHGDDYLGVGVRFSW
ncbi:MAG: hypothetical protein ACR2RV_06375 [Verrucomicrobiales bacterium]